MDEEYKARLETAYKKFSSKLKKLKYENYLELQRVIIEHIYQDTSYYGMNIYRLEKESRPYITSHEVKALLESSSPNEEKNILMKSSILSGICFPKLYNDFASFSNPWYSWFCAQSFSLFQELIVFSSHLIFDELIEKDYFGKKWEAFFLKTINDLTEKVFYNPNDIDFIAVPEAQDKFMQILADPVHNLLFQAAGITFS